MGLFGKDRDPVKILDSLGANWSPDFDAYARAETDVSQVRSVPCSHCGQVPCEAFANHEPR